MINLENYPPDYGEPVVLRGNQAYIALIVLCWPILTIIWFSLVFTPEQSTSNPIVESVLIFISILFVFGLTGTILNYLKHSASSITLTEEGFKKESFVSGSRFYSWTEIKNVKYDYQRPLLLLRGDELIKLISFETPTNSQNQICLNNFPVYPPDFSDLVEEWRKFHTARLEQGATNISDPTE